jgi:prepilin-type N-terminal cleavage/methylation domain-containing protein
MIKNIRGSRRQHPLGPDSQRGFTMIEMVVILGIIAVLIVVAFPNISGWRENQSLNRATRDVVAYLQFARQEAAKRNTTVCVGLTTTGRCVVFLPPPPPPPAPDPRILREMTMQPGVTVTSAATYQFNSRGFPNASGTVTVDNGNRSFDIGVSAAGSVTVDGPK